MEWISVKDRLPEIWWSITLKLIDGSEVNGYKSFFIDGYRRYDNNNENVFAIDVTHWKPIEPTNKPKPIK